MPSDLSSSSQAILMDDSGNISLAHQSIRCVYNLIIKLITQYLLKILKMNF